MPSRHTSLHEVQRNTPAKVTIYSAWLKRRVTMKQEWIWVEALPLVLGVGLVGCFMAAIALLPF